MKKGTLLLAAGLALALAACGPGAGNAPAQSKTPGQVLEEQPIDDTHDAFLVDTGGRLGTLLVTAEMGEERDPVEREYPVRFAVWNPADMSRPIQEMERTLFSTFHWHEELDANFDGYMDFSYQHIMGIQPSYWYLWLWDEDAGQFVEEPEYRNIAMPHCDPETGIISGWARCSGAGDGETTFHRWEDGRLVCVRRITAYCPWGEATTVSVEDRVDGELRQVYYEEFPWGTGECEGREAWRQARYQWENLDYHGES